LITLAQLSQRVGRPRPEAGTARGPNTIYVFSLDGRRIAHLGDLGQRDLRPEQRAAIGLRRPMHYRTPAIDFLEPPDAFLALFDDVGRLEGPGWTVPAERPPATLVVVLQPPLA
jgi:Beta-lactamase superfamily domain